jgi:hypothetical protein
VAVIREFYGVVTVRSIRAGFVVSSGTFTPEAEAFAQSCGIELLDGARLAEWVSHAAPAPVAPPQGLPRGRIRIRSRRLRSPYRRVRSAVLTWCFVPRNAAPLPVSAFGAARGFPSVGKRRSFRNRASETERVQR